MSSSSDIAIRVTGLSKKFRKGEIAHPRSLREAIGRLVPWGGGHKIPAAKRHDDRDFWALKDVSFELQRGEVLGIIGRNGAGKSTLLKVLSQIVAPTEGRVEVHGRLGALLEVGTGFHPELTGRENVFLNGALLGMTKTEIKKEFDSIVDFSGVEGFIDTPVKHYSSGMYMRLAFAVAAHLRNEVLIVDEVLAVGDAEFQKKCLGKMQDVSKSGRTVLFVSHNMDSMARLCTRMLSLKGGCLIEEGADVQRIINRYLFGECPGSTPLWNATERVGNRYFSAAAMSVVGEDGMPLSRGIIRGEPVWLKISGEIGEASELLSIGYRLLYEETPLIYTTAVDASRDQWPPLGVGRVELKTKIPTDFLNVGKYSVDMAVSLHNKEWIVSPYDGAPRVQFDVDRTAFPSPLPMAERLPSVLAHLGGWERGEAKAL